MDNLKHADLKAVESLKKDKMFKIDNIRLELSESDELIVLGWTKYRNFQTANKEIALSELEGIKHSFIDILKISPELEDFSKSKKIEYVLCINIPRSSSVAILVEKDGIIKSYI